MAVMTNMIRFITAEIWFACVGMELALKRTGKSRSAPWAVDPARKAVVLNRRLFFISFVVCYLDLSEYHVRDTSVKTEKPGFGYRAQISFESCGLCLIRAVPTAYAVYVFSGARPSSGAASSACSKALDFCQHATCFGRAAPEDGRAPLNRAIVLRHSVADFPKADFRP
jgi:hypothetical protein